MEPGFHSPSLRWQFNRAQSSPGRALLYLSPLAGRGRIASNAMRMRGTIHDSIYQKVPLTPTLSP